jgi:hypothetical protein
LYGRDEDGRCRLDARWIPQCSNWM